MDKISHISFSSGGLKGFCYLGVIRYLYLNKIVDNIKCVSGTSIGAYFALVMALKIPIEFMEEELMKLLHIFETSKFFSIGKHNFTQLFIENGIFDTDFFVEIFRKYLQQTYQQDDITFIELVKRNGINLYVTATNINTTKHQLFCVENTPNVSVIKAVSASMTIPFMFKPVYIDKEYYIDGVFSYDLPIEHFITVSKDQILGVQIGGYNCVQFDNNKTLNFLQYTTLIFQVILLTSIDKAVDRYADAYYVMKINDLPYNAPFKFKTVDGEITLDFTQEDFENLILKGFIDITNYMNERFPSTEIDT